MKTLTKEEQLRITPTKAVELLKNGNLRFLNNKKFERDLLTQVGETSENQHPFAVIISCMDSRVSSELIFDQGLGDIFSIRIAGNVINSDIIGSAEFGCKAVGAKVIVVMGHTNCGAIKGAIDNVHLGNLHSVTNKIQRVPSLGGRAPIYHDVRLRNQVTRENVLLGLSDIRSRSAILRDMELSGEIKLIGANYDVASGKVEFFENENVKPLTEERFTRLGAAS